MNAKRALLLVPLLAIACRKAPEPREKPIAPVGPVKVVDDKEERANLLTITRGATIVARTGEWTLDSSALSLIDGDPATAWFSPPADPLQSITAALPARTSITQVGLQSKSKITPRSMRFESSLDGQRFVELITVHPAQTDNVQLFDVKPSEAVYVRATVLEGGLPGREALLFGLHVRGTELQPPATPSPEGCWSINGFAASLGQHDAHAFGSVTTQHEPRLLEGGFDGRLYRFAWTRGKEYGYAAFTISPEDQHLSGLFWHEVAIPLFAGNTWFGDRAKCGAGEPHAEEILRAFLANEHHLFPLYSLRFGDDGSLTAGPANDDALALLAKVLPGLKRPRLVAHEFRKATPAANKDFAQKELASLAAALRARGLALTNVELVAQGSDSPRQIPNTDLYRAMYSAVELEGGE